MLRNIHSFTAVNSFNKSLLYNLEFVLIYFINFSPVLYVFIGVTQDFNVRVGVHQESVLSPYLFFVVIDEVTKEIQGKVP